MSRSPTICTARGTKRETLARLSALRAQFGEHGVQVEEHVQERRGLWRLRFKLTPDRERIRQINLKLKGTPPSFEPTTRQTFFLAALFGKSLLNQGDQRRARQAPARAEELEPLLANKLVRKTGDSFTLTVAGKRLVLRRLGGNE